jgi:hypothetical protein
MTIMRAPRHLKGRRVVLLLRDHQGQPAIRPKESQCRVYVKAAKTADLSERSMA